MTGYQYCRVDETVQHVTVSGGDGYGFHLRSGNRPVVHFAFATHEDGERARGEVASALEKAIEVTPQG
jgi:hypothetical protein